jgi:radical SAM superfamily enzyme YgiQ (UPF0313 family)
MYISQKKVISFVETVYTRLNIEAARGCSEQCRFCQTSKYYGHLWQTRDYKTKDRFLYKIVLHVDIVKAHNHRSSKRIKGIDSTK